MVKWKTSDVERITNQKLKPQTPKVKIPRPEAKGLIFIKNFLAMMSIDFVVEHRFHHVRKFLFDVAIPEHKIAIEYEGLVSNKCRHTTLKGYTGDCEKYNLAQSEGWIVLRYTTLNFKDFPNDLNKILKP